MKFADFKLAAAAGLVMALQGCAVVPFIPLIASAPHILMPAPPPGAQTVAAAPAPTPDPVVPREIATGKPADGDAGVSIPAQDRVSFSPDTAGSIPLRVASVDLVSDVKALATDLVCMVLKEHADRRAEAMHRIDEFLMDDPLPSVTSTDAVFSRGEGV